MAFPLIGLRIARLDQVNHRHRVQLWWVNSFYSLVSLILFFLFGFVFLFSSIFVLCDFQGTPGLDPWWSYCQNLFFRHGETSENLGGASKVSLTTPQQSINQTQSNKNNKTNKLTQSIFDRTPWTIKFHPRLPNIVASGCLGGEVRIWDIKREDGPLLEMRFPLKTPGASSSSSSPVANQEEAILSLCFHNLGESVAVACGSQVFLWNYAAGKDPVVIFTASNLHPIEVVHFPIKASPDLLLVGYNRRKMKGYFLLDFILEPSIRSCLQ